MLSYVCFVLCLCRDFLCFRMSALFDISVGTVD